MTRTKEEKEEEFRQLSAQWRRIAASEDGTPLTPELVEMKQRMSRARETNRLAREDAERRRRMGLPTRAQELRDRARARELKRSAKGKKAKVAVAKSRTREVPSEG